MANTSPFGSFIRNIPKRHYLILETCTLRAVKIHEVGFTGAKLAPSRRVLTFLRQTTACKKINSTGAALSSCYLLHKKERNTFSECEEMQEAYLDPSFDDGEIGARFIACGVRFKKLNEGELIEEVANAVVGGKAVVWLLGRIEFSPRALGGRTIITYPRSPAMQKQLNIKVKYR